MTTDISDEEVIQKVLERILEKHPEVPPRQGEILVREEFANLSGNPVRDYLAVLTERAVRKRLGVVAA